MKQALTTLLAFGLLTAAADAKVYRSTYNHNSQTGSVTLAHPQVVPLNLTTNQITTAFTLRAKTRVAINVSALCAVASPGVGLIPPENLGLYLKVQVDGQTLPESLGYLACVGDDTDDTDHYDMVSFTVAKRLSAGRHTLQVIPNPQPVLATGTHYLVSGLSVVVMD